MAKTKNADKGANPEAQAADSGPDQQATGAETETAMPSTDVGGADVAVRTAEEANAATPAKAKRATPAAAAPTRSVASVMRFRRRIRPRQ